MSILTQNLNVFIMDAKKIKEVNGTDIFLDLYTHKFYYWDNGNKRTSASLDKLINKLNK